jgi:hypothetical protein
VVGFVSRVLDGHPGSVRGVIDMPPGLVVVPGGRRVGPVAVARAVLGDGGNRTHMRARERGTVYGA